MSILQALLDHTRQHVYNANPSPLGNMGVFHCHHHQRLRAVPLWHPTLILVLQGAKRLQTGTIDKTCVAGEMLLIPAHSEVQLENIPNAHSGDYLALCVSFFPATIAEFVNNAGRELDWRTQSLHLCAPAPESIVFSLLQRMQWSNALCADPSLMELRQQELLTLCARHALLGNLLSNKHSSAAQRVGALIGMNCAHDWKIQEVARQLSMSETTLRRELNREATGFRELLEQMRLTAGLGLLQETRYSVTEVAARVGYDSPSRFAARFRERFGVTPSELKQSREKTLHRYPQFKMAESGACLNESGARPRR